MEKRRGKREIEVTRKRRGGIKRGESKLASHQFPMCSPQSGPLREEKRQEGDRGDQEEKGGIKRRELDLGSAPFPKCSLQPGTHRDSQSWVEKRKGREEIEVVWGRKRRVKRERK